MKHKPPSGKELSTLQQPKVLNSEGNKRLFTMPEMLRLANVTRKQATYWAEIKLVNPVMRNTKALTGHPSSFYTAEEVIKAMIIAYLKRSGFSLRQIEQVIKNLEEHGISLDKSQNYLLTDGYSVYYASSDNDVIDILKHNRQRLLLIPIHEQVEKLQRVA